MFTAGEDGIRLRTMPNKATKSGGKQRRSPLCICIQASQKYPQQAVVSRIGLPRVSIFLLKRYAGTNSIHLSKDDWSACVCVCVRVRVRVCMSSMPEAMER